MTLLDHADTLYGGDPDAVVPLLILRVEISRLLGAPSEEALERLQGVDATRLHPHLRVRLDAVRLQYWLDIGEISRIKLWLKFMPEMQSLHHPNAQADARNRLRALAFLRREAEWQALAHKARTAAHDRLPVDAARLEAMICQQMGGGSASGPWHEELIRVGRWADLAQAAGIPAPVWPAMLRRYPELRAQANANSVYRVSPALDFRSQQLLQALADGLSNKQISDRLCLALGTVKNQLTTLYGLIGVENRAEAAQWWFKRNELTAGME